MIQAPAKLAYRIPEAVQATGIPRSTIYQEIRAGRLRTCKLGARTLITAEALRTWLAMLEAQQAPEAEAARLLARAAASEP